MNWVMMRGLGRHSDHWGVFSELMADNFNQTIKLNFPGTESKINNPPTSIQTITDHLREQFLAKKNDDKWGIVAISLGGMVALDWTSRYPEDFKHLITINSSTKTHSKFYERMQPKAIAGILSMAFQKDLRAREKKVLELTTNQLDINDKVLDWAVNIANKMNMDKKTFASQLLAATKFEIPHTLKVPYTTIVSERDHFTSPKCSKAIAKHFNSELVIHPTAGHDLPSDDPNWLLEIIKDISKRY